MILERTIAVVVPCFNEERQLPRVLGTMPPEADLVFVVDDASTDRTADVVRDHAARDPRIKLLRHDRNEGVGGAIASGYIASRDAAVDIAVVMAGDGQMDPRDFRSIVEPVASGDVDFAKGNRLIAEDAVREIPISRFIGNAVLSLLTKIASGYWHVADSQSGYTAIGQTALQTIDWGTMYKRYGQPNDLLVRLNVHGFKVRDVTMAPVYGRGEVSKMRKRKVVFSLSWLLVKLFIWRLTAKYVIRDFHPLVFFWLLAFTLMPVAAALGIRTVVLWVQNGNVPPMTALAFGFCAVTALQSACFALLFDMEANRDLR